MKKILFGFAFILIGLFSSVEAQSTWSLDRAHSSVNFTIKHLGVSFVQGRFDAFHGKISSEDQNLTNGGFNFTINTESINTGVEARDKHLRSADFFDAGKFPEMSFDGQLVKDKGNYFLKGKLNIKDVSKQVNIPVVFGGTSKNMEGKEVVGLQAKFTVNRLDYNIKYDPTGAGIAKDVEVNLYLEFLK